MAYHAAYNPGVSSSHPETLVVEDPKEEHYLHPLNSEATSFSGRECHDDAIRLSDQAVGLAGRILDRGRMLFVQQRRYAEMGEGPALLRLLCFLGGVGMVIASVSAVMNVLSLLTAPSIYVLQLYQGFFGLITMILEAKDWEFLERLKPWMHEWFRFLTVPAGKGVFYVFVGSLGISLWVRNFLAFIVGLYMTTVGLICVAIHTGVSSSSSRLRRQRAGRTATESSVWHGGHVSHFETLFDSRYEPATDSDGCSDVDHEDYFSNNFYGHDDTSALGVDDGSCQITGDSATAAAITTSDLSEQPHHHCRLQETASSSTTTATTVGGSHTHLAKSSKGMR